MIGAAVEFQRLELLLQVVAGEFLGQLGFGQLLALDFLDLRRHPLEVLEGALVRHRGHGPLNALRRLGTLLTGHQQILFALRLFDLVVESAERRLECFRLGLVTDPRFMQRLRGLHVLVLPHQRLLGQVVAVLLHAEHRPLLPLFRLFLFFFDLSCQLLLISDRRRHFLFRLCQLTPHVGDQLIQDLLRVFRAVDEIVDVRFEQRTQAIKDPHISTP